MSTWTPPVDLRERMLRHTIRGTNLDPDRDRNASECPAQMSVDQRKAKAAQDARDRRARRKQERLDPTGV